MPPIKLSTFLFTCALYTQHPPRKFPITLLNPVEMLLFIDYLLRLFQKVVHSIFCVSFIPPMKFHHTLLHDLCLLSLPFSLEDSHGQELCFMNLGSPYLGLSITAKWLISVTECISFSSAKLYCHVLLMTQFFL